MTAAAEQQEFGRYTLVKKLATGGMAQIWLARQTGIQGFQKLVVVKKILPHLSENEEFVQMFLDEARIAARLNHPNIVQIHDLGKIGEEYFIAMEFIHGEDVRRVWKQADAVGRPLPVPLACRVVIGACEGLHYAHVKADDQGRPLGIVHRDVSPQNILVSFEGGVKVVDFGIAKAADQATSTRTGVLKGKYSYMSPEQAQGQKLDHRSDVFAVGVVLYELLTGSRLFKRANEILTLNAVIECRVEPPSALRGGIPPELDAVCLKALARRVEDRYPDCRALQLALEDVLVKRQLPSSSAHLAQFLKEIYKDRLEAEAQSGLLPVDDEPSKSSRSVKVPGGVSSREDRSVKVKTPLPRDRGDPGATLAATVSGRAAPRRSDDAEVSVSKRFRGISDPRRGAEDEPPPRGTQARTASGGKVSRPPVEEEPGAKTEPCLGAADVVFPEPARPPPRREEAPPPDEDTGTGGRRARESARRGMPALAGLLALVLVLGAGFVLREHLAAALGLGGLATLVVESDPPGATVEVNGVPQGKTPATVQVLPGAGSKLRLTLDGHEPVEQPIGPLAAGQVERVGPVPLPKAAERPRQAALQGSPRAQEAPRPAPDGGGEARPRGHGGVRIDADVSASVAVAGQRGRTGEDLRVPAGKHKVVVTATFESIPFTRSLTVDVPEGGSVQRHVSFQPGSIFFYTVPPSIGAEILYEGRLVARLPRKAFLFPSGDHTFVVKNDELGWSERRTVGVTAGEETKVSLSAR